MKKTICALAILIFAFSITSFKPTLAPRIYPELEAFFKSVEKADFDNDHHNALENLKYNIVTSHFDNSDWNLIFYCSENTFRSQASQVFAQTLCYARKHKNVKAFSAGVTSGEISPKLIEFLTKIGYKVSKSEKEGIPTYEVKFSDLAAPIVLYSKDITDKSLPKKDITSVIVCDVKNESDCASLKTETTPLNLVYQKVLPTDGNDKIESTLKGIASAMVYVTKK